jgi:hypothetical protein
LGKCGICPEGTIETIETLVPDVAPHTGGTIFINEIVFFIHTCFYHRMITALRQTFITSTDNTERITTDIFTNLVGFNEDFLLEVKATVVVCIPAQMHLSIYTLRRTIRATALLFDTSAHAIGLGSMATRTNTWRRRSILTTHTYAFRYGRQTVVFPFLAGD